MLYAFIHSSNYSNLYNILQPEALDLESYRKYIEQNNVIFFGDHFFQKPIRKSENKQTTLMIDSKLHILIRRYAERFMWVVRVLNRPSSCTSIWYPISWQQPCIGLKNCWMKDCASCTTAATWISLSPIHCPKMPISIWNGKDRKSIVQLVAKR